ncbi:sensor histidine kinase [Streptomyces sp. ME19-01-6]|uniref:sensor histidine kinase n=1 Tax=Streptomyces sp. ME19-01-6 TaxID=3028686 RepID=UPI0029A8D7BB|nr:histidine kinase [Streptomyces sp. ME19-01-6]MDX3227668.1 histidine kinase [Streptomyces sp. ME19-01-6]
MWKPIRPLFRADTVRGWVYALAGAAWSLPPTAVALAVAAGVARSWPVGLRWVCFGAVFVALLAAGGFPRAVRARCVRLANRLLCTGLPAPGASPGGGRPDLVRTSAWLALHMAVGWAVAAVTGLLAAVAAVLAGVWFHGGDRVALLGLSVRVAGGWRGGWVPLAAMGCLVAAAGVCAGAVAVLRSAAPALLGPRPAERLAALEERTRLLAGRNRLAQELHDSIGHTLTAATIQAAVAAELMEREPEAARRALSSIEESSRSAMDDLDHVLGVLREGKAPTAPQHTLGDLRALLERVRQTGTEVRADLHGDWARVPAAVSRETYRIVQEGLTNALRHAHRAPVTLRVTVTDDWLEAELTNPLAGGRGLGLTRPGRRGQGLAGIGERMRLLRGEVSVGPVPGGRWRLLARIPLRSAP